MTSVFDFDDYRQFLQHKRGENGHLRGFQSKMAAAAGCQRAYLSQVLNGHVQLTPDHAMGLARLFCLGDSELEYFMDLVNKERARSHQLKDWTERRLKSQRAARTNISRRFGASAFVENQDAVNYYAHWYMSAIHILVGIPNFRTASQISARLGLSFDVASEALARLEKMQLVESRGKSWFRTTESVHLSKNSPMNTVNHMNWRHRSVAAIQANRDDELHYTAIHSLGVKDADRIKKMLVECLDGTRAVVAPSPDEELVCLTCDFFRVT